MILKFLRSKLLQHALAGLGGGSGGGGNSGGGGGSGNIRYPPYIERHHYKYLEALDVAIDGATDFLSANMVTNPRFDMSGTSGFGSNHDYGWEGHADWTFAQGSLDNTAADYTQRASQNASFIGAPYGGGEEYVVSVNISSFVQTSVGLETGPSTTTNVEPIGETTINITTTTLVHEIGDVIQFGTDPQEYVVQTKATISGTGDLTILPALLIATTGGGSVTFTPKSGLRIDFGGAEVDWEDGANKRGSWSGTVTPTGLTTLEIYGGGTIDVDITYVSVNRYAASPFDDGLGGVIEAFNPNEAFTYVDDSFLDRTQSQFDTLSGLIDAIDPENDWEDFLATAINSFDSDVLAEATIDDTEIDTLTDNFELRQRTPHLKALSRLTAGFAAMGAAHSSQLPVAAALMEVGYQQVLGDFESNVRVRVAELNFSSELEYRTQRLGFIFESIRFVASQVSAKIAAGAHASNLQAEINRVAYTAMTEYEAQTQAYVIKDAVWGMDNFAYMGNLMAGPGGGVSSTPGANASALGARGSTLGGTIGAIASGISSGMAMYNSMSGAFSQSGTAQGAASSGGGMRGIMSMGTPAISPQMSAALSTHGSEGQTELSASVASKSLGGSGNIKPKYTQGATIATQFGPAGWVVAAAIMGAGTLESVGVSEHVTGVHQTEWLNEHVLNA